MLGVKQGYGPVAFVALSHEKFASRVPVRVCAEDWDLSADVMGRMQSAFAQDVGGHCRRGRFAMHPDDQDAALGRHDCGERFRTPDSSLSVLASVFQNRIVRFDR